MAGLRLILAVVLSLSVMARGHWPTPNRWLSIRGGDGFGLNNLFGDKSKEPADSSLPDIDSLFGEGGDKGSKPGNGSAGNGAYEALTKEEIYELLRSVPVFTVTDDEGKSVIVQTEDGQHVISYFLEASIAMMQKEKLEEKNSDYKLQVRGRPLSEAVQLRDASAEAKEQAAKELERPFPQIHIWPSPRERMVASHLEQNSTAVNTHRFEEPYNAIPVYTCRQMAVQIDGEPVRPWFFSLDHMMKTWKTVQNKEGEEKAAEMDGDVHMASLEELIEAMQKSSEVNFRKIMFMPSPEAVAAIAASLKEEEGEGGDKK